MPARAVRAAGKRTKRQAPKQVNIRIESALYQSLEIIAAQERRSVPQAARQLIEAGLRQQMSRQAYADDVSSLEIAALATAGGAFDWLAEEPDLYDDTCGEPL